MGDGGDLHVAVDGDLGVALDVAARSIASPAQAGRTCSSEGYPWPVGVVVPGDFAQHPHVAVDQPPRPCAGRLLRGELLAHAQPRNDAEHLVVGVHRARQRVDLRPMRSSTRVSMPYCPSSVAAAMPAGPPPTTTTGTRLLGPGRSFAAHLYTITLRWTPRSMAASSVAMVASTTSPSCRYAGFFLFELRRHWNAPQVDVTLRGDAVQGKCGAHRSSGQQDVSGVDLLELRQRLQCLHRRVEHVARQRSVLAHLAVDRSRSRSSPKRFQFLGRGPAPGRVRPA